MSSAAPVAVSGLNHAYGRGPLRKQVLYDISTEIPAGEIVIVTGPSGSGKTTLLTIVGALRAAQRGSVRVLGEELCAAKARTLEKVRRQIGFIFQQHNLLDALTALQNVELGVRVAGHTGRAGRKRAAEMLDAVGLTEQMHSKPEQLSGGQRQRVAIARALAAEPAMLLADEPTASLDRRSGREVVDRMQALARQRGTTILLVTHDNRILDVADRLLHLEDGRLSSFTDAVIANTQHMMHMLAESNQRQSLGELVDELDEASFRDAVREIAGESQRFLEATGLANNEAYQSILEQALRAFTRRVGQMLNAERASMFLVDRDGKSLILKVAEDLPQDRTVRIPLTTGIAGAVASSGETIRIADAYADPRFNPDIDRETGFRTRSILCLPLRNRNGEVFAVTQLLNRKDGAPFAAEDETKFEEFSESLGVILETVSGWSTGQD